MGKKEVKTPRFADAKVSVHDLTLEELDRRIAMLHSMKEALKSRLPKEKYLEIYSEISDMYLFDI